MAFIMYLPQKGLLEEKGRILFTRIIFNKGQSNLI